MNESLKVQPHHLVRDAYLYIRQSSMRQVVENIESTQRQYALRTRATALGWPGDRVVVIDCDQGESGASAAWREGFRPLVTDVGLGRAGIVMGLEVSRLARNNADWHRLLEICALEKEAHLQFPGAEVTPYLFQAGTDAGAWRTRGVPVYGIYPYAIDAEDLTRMHGNDERVSVQSLRQGTQMIYETLVDVAARR